MGQRSRELVRVGISVWRGFERAAAWLLIPLLLLQFVSGYAILHPRILGGVMDKMTAFRVHGAIQPLTVTAFVVHGFPAIRRRLARWKLRGGWLDLLLALVGAGAIAFFTYLWALG